MLPPLLEIYVVWHPDDAGGSDVASRLIDHFHGTAFSGLVGGAIEVFVRSQAWREGDAPRPLPYVTALPEGVRQAELTVVLPVLGRGMAVAARDDAIWRAYLDALRQEANDSVLIIPVALESTPTDGLLSDLLGDLQGVTPAPEMCRDVAQTIAQFAAGTKAPIRVFVSHTKRIGHGGDAPAAVVERVRDAILHSKLREYFDESDLTPGCDWSEDLKTHAASSALLAVRTDLYSSRAWCQREVLIAKEAGMPAVILDVLSEGEERGSFLMDNLPRVPGKQELQGEMVSRALDQLVDQCLKRALWDRQRTLAESEHLDVATWWAPHAPEPVTFVSWIKQQPEVISGTEPVVVLHPDPPLGPDEVRALDDLAAVIGLENRLHVMTPRGLATYGI